MFSRSASIMSFRTLLVAAALAMVSIVAVSADEPAAVQPKVGEMAPAISLMDQTGKTVNLSDYKGKWVVVYFYPKDQTPGCTTQACEFRDNIFAYRNAGAQVLGVSVDDVESHKKFAEEHGLPFPLLADATKTTAKRYGVLKKMGPMEIAARETFLVDPSGKIAKHYIVGRDNLEGHSKVVLADIETFKSSAKKG